MGVSMHGSTIEDRDGRTGGGGSGGGGAGGNGGGSSPGGGNWSAPETHYFKGERYLRREGIAEHNRGESLFGPPNGPNSQKVSQDNHLHFFPSGDVRATEGSRHYDVHGAVANTSLPNTIIFREASFRMLR